MEADQPKNILSRLERLIERETEGCSGELTPVQLISVAAGRVSMGAPTFILIDGFHTRTKHLLKMMCEVGVARATNLKSAMSRRDLRKDLEIWFDEYDSLRAIQCMTR